MTGPSPPSNYKWIALGVTTIGVLMTAIDATVVILAMPDIMTDLHSNLVSLIWVLMSYILASTVFLLALGRVADLYGRVKLYNLGFVVFTIGSALCGLSSGDGELIVFRAIQGTGGALLIVNSLAIVTEAFPRGERGTAMGYNSIAFAAGSIVGPVLGGLILSVSNWRWIFLINIPVGIVGTAAASKYLHRGTVTRAGEKLDLPGSVLFSLSLLCLLLALTQSIEMGWHSRTVILFLVGFVVGLIAFQLVEMRSSSPALDPRLFRSRLYDFSVLAAMLQSLSIFAVQFLIVFYLQAVRGYSPLSAAFGLLPLPIVNAFSGPIGGRISDRTGARLPASTGLLIQVVALYWLSLTTDTSPYWHIAVGLALMGLGGGLFYSPNTSSAMGASPPDRLGVAAATLSTLRNIGMVVSFALALAVAAGSLPRDVMLKLFIGTSVHLRTSLMVAFVGGMQAALRASIVICLIAALMSLVRGREARV